MPLLARRGVCTEGADGVVVQDSQFDSKEKVQAIAGPLLGICGDARRNFGLGHSAYLEPPKICGD